MVVKVDSGRQLQVVEVEADTTVEAVVEMTVAALGQMVEAVEVEAHL